VHPTDGVVLNSLIDDAGDLIVGSADNTVGRLALGSDGQVLTVDTAGTGVAKVKWDDPAGGLPTQTSQEGKFLNTNGTTASWVDPPTNRNLLINGAMQVAQRGTSVAVADAGLLADRFRTDFAGLGAFTASIENDAPTGSGFRKSLKLLCGTADASPAAGDVLSLTQRLEGQNLQHIRKGTSDAQQLTLSFWVKSNVTGTYIAELFDTDNTRSVGAMYSISSSGTWERKVITFPADTTGALNDDNGLSLIAIFFLGAGTTFTSGTLATTWAGTTAANRAVGQTNLAAATNNYWQITGVQLETGPVATPFEFEPFEATLRKCQRYYYKLEAAGAGPLLAVGGCQTTTLARLETVFPVAMRTRPTAVETTGTPANYQLLHGNDAETALTAISYSGLTNGQYGSLQVTVASGLTAGLIARLNRAAGTPYVGWSAEL
jgi:hypothetical protein